MQPADAACIALLWQCCEMLALLQAIVEREDMSIILEQPLHRWHQAHSELLPFEAPRWAQNGLACFIPANRSVLCLSTSGKIVSCISQLPSEISSIASISPCGQMLVSQDSHGFCGRRWHFCLLTSQLSEVDGRRLRSLDVANIAWHPCPPAGSIIYAAELEFGSLVLVDARRHRDINHWDLVGELNMSSEEYNYQLGKPWVRSALSWSPDGRQLAIAHPAFAAVLSFQEAACV